MSSKGITTEDIAQMKYNEAQAYGFTTDEYGTLMTQEMNEVKFQKELLRQS
jgi:hypothetical protein